MAKLPKNLQDLFDAKDKYLTSQRNNLELSVLNMQEKLLNDIIMNIVSELDTENGQIKQTTKNMRLISELESTYENFNKTVQIPVVKNLGKGLLGINDYNTNYFKEILLDTTTKKRFNSVIENTNTFLKTRIGVGAKNEIIEGGFLDSFITDRSLLTDVKNLTIRSITGQMPISDFKDLLKYKVVGKEGVVDGKFQQYYRQFAYDEYNRYDRSYGEMIGKEFDLNYAIYQGGLIDSSREFCEFHNNKVWTKEEIANFGKWKDSSGTIPSYLKIPGYNPAVDLGGYNCRHSLTYVDKITAYRLRPELKNNNKI